MPQGMGSLRGAQGPEFPWVPTLALCGGPQPRPMWDAAAYGMVASPEDCPHEPGHKRVLTNGGCGCRLGKLDEL